MYEKAVIYKLCCLDPEIKDCYVGSTCNLRLRKSQHKKVCNNPNDNRHNLKVYQFIRENGGWTNWTIVVLEQYPCNSKIEMYSRERYHFETLGATLNSQYPNRSKQEWYEANEERIKEYRKEWEETNPEKLKQYKKKYRQANAEKIKQQNSKKVKCECGTEITSRHIERHRKTNKHLKKMTTTE